MADDAQKQTKVDLDALSVEDKIKYYYEHGHSIQVIARSYRYTVDEVLKVLHMEDLMSVTTTGDMIDQEEAGTEPVNYAGTTHRAHYSTD
jgi:hypothetical protein